MNPAGPRTARAIRDVRTLEMAGERSAAVFLDGRVALLAPESGISRGDLERAAAGALLEEMDGGGRWLLPGWIDLQVNDLAWLSAGLHPEEETCRRIRKVLAHQAARGTTALALATLAAPEEEVLAYLRGAARVREGREPLDRAFLGVLVEGTFMNPAHHGAHNPAHVRRPERALLDRLLDTGGARLVNIAPEMAPEALELIRHAVRRGALVGVGHARPSGERARAAVEAGLSYVIHLGNGPTGSSLKGFAEGGLMEEALRNDRMAVTLIADGVHLDRRLVRDIIARKGIDRVAGVSDAAFALDRPARGETFTAFGIRGEVSADGRFLRVLPPPEALPSPHSSDAAMLFGSAIGMREVFENALGWLSVEMEGIHHRLHPALPFLEAMRSASAIASGTPARILGEPDRGTLRVKARADAVLAAIDGGPGDYRAAVEAVWVSGEPAPPPEAP